MAGRASLAPKSAGNSPDKLGHVFNRALTISSSHPLGHKDKKISGEKRARFEALDLEVTVAYAVTFDYALSLASYMAALGAARGVCYSG